MRNYGIVGISIISTISTIYSIAKDTYPFIAGFLRPVIVIIFSSSIRSTMAQAFSNAKDSAAIIILILLFIGYYTIIAYYLYRGTLQGYQNFSSPEETLY